ncbi:hypothetical protein [Castellaniella sp.]|uniref:hypothetical protein n=1 Tax=Castellaniella sp. TaxID=1955812 RepID=UPI002AFDEBA1|nr:hypothetical protein [Castellaniella sp.]
MKRRAFLAAAGAAVMLGLTACGSDDGEKYLGTWKATRGSLGLTIEKNGKDFIITHTGGMKWSADEENKKSSATVNKHGQLEVSAGPMTITGSIEEKTGHLIIGGKEYVRVE